MSSTHCELPSSPNEPRFLDGHLQVRHAASVVPGLEVMEIRQHLRGDGDVHEDGWIVLARFRTWVGIPAWRRTRRRGSSVAERGQRTVSSLPLHGHATVPRRRRPHRTTFG